MTSAIHLPCKCGAERTDVDLGSGRCVQCRRERGEVTTLEIEAALARCDRSRGGTTPVVAWQCPLTGLNLWASRPGLKEHPRRVIVIPIDEEYE